MNSNSSKKAYFLLFAAVFASSFVSVFAKIAAQFPFFSPRFLFFYGLAMSINVAYAVAWQLILEKIPLITAYMARGILFVLIYVWSALIFAERLNGIQMVGAALILTGVFISQYGKV